MSWYIAVLKNYAGFSGRARRKEYWMFTLFQVLAVIAVAIVGGILAAVTHSPILLLVPVALYVLGTFIPSLAVGVRRLHDTGRPGVWLLLNYVPIVNYVGWIVILVFDCLDSQPGPNQYGPNPKTMEFTPDGYGFVGYPPYGQGYPQAPGYPPAYPPQAPGYPPQGPVEGPGPDSAQDFTGR